MPAPERPWVVIQHVAHEGPGASEPGRGRAPARTLSVVRVDEGDAVPAPDRSLAAMAGLVVMGGPMSVHDDLSRGCTTSGPSCAPPWRPGLPVLGVCLGAQQLAAALGAAVTRGPGARVRRGRGAPDPRGHRGPGVRAGSDPTAVRALARRDVLPCPRVRCGWPGNDAYENQAFRVGARPTGCSSTWR